MTSPRDLTADLRALPHPTPPPDMTGRVIARVAQLPISVEAPEPHLERNTTSAAARADWPVWISLAGLVAGLAMAMLNFPISADAASLGRGGAMGGLEDLSTAPQATVALVAGFAIYLVSLFLPVRERR